jgi:hypothetical protein
MGYLKATPRSPQKQSTPCGIVGIIPVSAALSSIPAARNHRPPKREKEASRPSPALSTALPVFRRSVISQVCREIVGRAVESKVLGSRGRGSSGRSGGSRSSLLLLLLGSGSLRSRSRSGLGGGGGSRLGGSYGLGGSRRGSGSRSRGRGSLGGGSGSSRGGFGGRSCSGSGFGTVSMYLGKGLCFHVSERTRSRGLLGLRLLSSGGLGGGRSRSDLSCIANLSAPMSLTRGGGLHHGDSPAGASAGAAAAAVSVLVASAAAAAAVVAAAAGVAAAGASSVFLSSAGFLMALSLRFLKAALSLPFRLSKAPNAVGRTSRSAGHSHSWRSLARPSLVDRSFSCGRRGCHRVWGIARPSLDSNRLDGCDSLKQSPHQRRRALEG